jgi:hypothetical protein
MPWKDRKHVSASIVSALGNPLVVRAEELTGCRLPDGTVLTVVDHVIKMDTVAKNVYELLFTNGQPKPSEN